MKLLNIGFGNLVSEDRIISILSPDSAPIKRIIQDNKKQGILVDASCGKKTRSVIIMDSGHIILSSLNSETILGRIIKNDISINEENI